MRTARTMQKLRQEQILYRDYPIALWLMGVLAIVVGVLVDEGIPTRSIFVLLGIAAVGLLSALTVTCDRRQRTLRLHYRSLFRHSIKSYAWSEVCGVGVREDTGEEGFFRVEIFLCSGEVVPLRSWYTPWKSGQMRLVRKLESLLAQ